MDKPSFPYSEWPYFCDQYSPFCSFLINFEYDIFITKLSEGERMDQESNQKLEQINESIMEIAKSQALIYAELKVIKEQLDKPGD